MKILIRETSAVKTLSIIDPKTGVDYIEDFIGSEGALSDGQFVWNEEHNAYVCSQYTFDWWDTAVSENQLLDYRIHELIKKHGSEAVYSAVYSVAGTDIEDHAKYLNQALDEAFGSAID